MTIPALERGIHLTVQDGEYGEHFVVGVSLHNPSDEEVVLRTASGALFGGMKMTERTFTSSGRRTLWRETSAHTMDTPRWTVKPNATHVQTWPVPNAKEAYEQALEVQEELSGGVTNFTARDWLVDELQPVEPSRAGVVNISVSFPAPNNYSDSVTRQYDLRNNMEQVLDSKIPEGDEGAIERMNLALG